MTFGWLGPYAAQSEWELKAGCFPSFRIYGASEIKRTCAWDNWEKLGWNINDSQLYKQEIGDCYDGDAIVLGTKTRKIRDINVGDVVFDGTGQLTTVVSKRVKRAAGPLYAITCSGALPTKVTGDHKLLVVRTHKHKGRDVVPGYDRREGLSPERVRDILTATKPEWMRACDVQEGDYLLHPLDVDVRPAESGCTEDMRWLIGFFIANGTCDIGTVSFTVADSRPAVLVKVKEAIANAGYSWKERRATNGGKASEVRVHSRHFAAWLRAICYDGKQKVMPVWLLGCKHTIEGIVAGDGHQTKDGTVIITSISLPLIHAIETSLIMQGIVPAVGTHARGKGVYANAKPLYRVQFLRERKRLHGARMFGNYLGRRVRKIEVLEGPHEVYDIGVESEHHSFIANGTVGHNCVSFGAAIAVAAVAAHEIVRLGDFEQFKVPFAPYLYGISRLTPEGGNGRLGGSDGSLGSWMADTIVKYGVLRDDFEGVPRYSGRVAKQWGTRRNAWDGFVGEADDHPIKSAARIRSVTDLAQAVANGYYCTIASMRGYDMQLKNDRGKSWFKGRDTWPHQMSIIAVDTEPELCFYRRNQWGTAHGQQLDGPDGGGWVTADSLEKEIADSGTECFAMSNFIGFPSKAEKPRNYFA